MSNLAKVIPIRPPLEVVERQVADLDDGYTRIANELLEAVMSADLTARQLKVVLAIIRKTYGFGKKLDRITNTQISAMTGVHHTHVCTAKNDMIAMHIVVSVGNMIGVNKVVSEWKTDISRISETLADSANKSLANTANGYSPTQLNTKETIQKIKENIPTHTRLEGGEDDVLLREKLISLLQGRLIFGDAKALHDAVEAEILKAGYLCQREFLVADRGDGRRGRVDLYVTDSTGSACGIEIDRKSPREKSVFKLQQLPSGFILLRDSGVADRYEIAGIPVVNANDGDAAKNPTIPYQTFLDAYNDILGDRLPNARDLTDKRRRAIKKLLPRLKTPNVDGFRAYLGAFSRMAKPFYFGDNKTGWCADFDFMLRETTLVGVREGKFADREVAE